jgi:hypothetical protein
MFETVVHTSHLAGNLVALVKDQSESLAKYGNNPDNADRIIRSVDMNGGAPEWRESSGDS